MNLNEIAASLVDGRTKGIPDGPPFMLRDIGSKGWNVLRGDLPLPVAVLKQSVIDHNSDWMRRFLAQSGASIAPHGKTTMSPQLFARQLADGAWAITVANVQQMAVAVAAGCRRIIIANQVVGAAETRALFAALREHVDLAAYCLVDSVAGVSQLAAAARADNGANVLHCLVEGGVAGGRTGCRSVAEALAVARAVNAAGPRLALSGVEGFEGIVTASTPGGTVAAVEAFLDFLVAIARTLEDAHLFADGELILSAGGSMYYDLAVEGLAAAGMKRTTRVVTRSGCYLTHDSGQYGEGFVELRKRRPEIDALGPGLAPALFVWAYVQSRPEPKKAIATLGKRDVSFDVALPQPVARYRPGSGVGPVPIHGTTTVGLNDQHCHLALADHNDLAVGDVLCFGISHPCTTFDKWKVVPLVDDDWNVTDAVRTFF